MLSIRIPQEFPSSAQSVSFNSRSYNLASLFSYGSHVTHALILLPLVSSRDPEQLQWKVSLLTLTYQAYHVYASVPTTQRENPLKSEAEIPLPAWPAKRYYSLFCSPQRAGNQENAGVKTTSFCGRPTVAQVTQGKKEWESRMDTSEVRVQITWL